MEINIMEILNMINLMVKENLYKPMETNIQVSGIKTKKKDQELYKSIINF